MAWKGNARLNPRRDGNEKPIIDALRAQGFHVVQINGTGVPDLLVSKRVKLPAFRCSRCGGLRYREYRDLCSCCATITCIKTVVPGDVVPGDPGGGCWLVEVKKPKGKYKPSQIRFRESWQGPPIITLRSVDDALKFQLLVCETGA